MPVTVTVEDVKGESFGPPAARDRTVSTASVVDAQD